MAGENHNKVDKMKNNRLSKTSILLDEYSIVQPFARA